MAVLTVLGGAACEGTDSVSYRYRTGAEDGGGTGRGSGGTHAQSGSDAMAGGTAGSATTGNAGEPVSSAGDAQAGREAAAGAATNAGGAAGVGSVPDDCATAADCGAPSDCAIPACNDGSCELVLVPEGSFVRFDEQPCRAVVCDGAGSTKLVPSPGNLAPATRDCTVHTCALDGVLVTTQAPLGASCGFGSAQRCDGDGQCVDCIVSQDCAGSLACIQGKCQAPAESCSNQHIDGSETDIDCGGKSCAPCATGADCYTDGDCVTQACDFLAPGRCVASHCLDHHIDGDETDQDCGGPTCGVCQASRACKLDGDCTSGLCHPQFHFCLPDHCSDNVQDNGELGVDCGNGCYGCALGSDCQMNFDCLSGACDANSLKCIADQCQDHHVDGNETDADCGGSDCAPCPIGKKCVTTADCAPGGTCPAVPPKACY